MVKLFPEAKASPLRLLTYHDFELGKIYGIMDKKFITKENKTAYVKLERIVLDPGIVKLFFTFQDTQSLCR
ncbi:unnamed protein product [Arabidopsis halleri]